MSTEIKFSIFFVVIVFVLFLQALQLPFFQDGGGIGPGFFPISLTIILLGLIGIYLRNVFLRRNEENDKKNMSKDIVLKQVYLITSLALSILLASYLGLLVTIAFFLFVAFIVIEKLRLVKSAIFSVLTTLSIYLIFDLWLGLNLPMGIFG